MEKVMVYYHKETDTLDIWFGNPQDEHSCEEMGEGVVLKSSMSIKAWTDYPHPSRRRLS